MKKVPVKGPSAKNVLADKLLSDLRALIINAKNKVAQTVNAELTLLYWHIGRRIRQDILRDNRAQYGQEIISALRRQLASEFGRGFSEKSLRHMIRFAEAFPDPKIVSALRRQLSWSHFVQIIQFDDPLKPESTIVTMERSDHDLPHLATVKKVMNSPQLMRGKG